MKASEYSKYIGKFSRSEKVYFYETLAHNLTVSARNIWSNPECTNDAIVEQLKGVNEILHRVTSKIKVERLELHDWPENEFIKMINHYVKIWPSIGHEIAHAINHSYEITIDKEQNS